MEISRIPAYHIAQGPDGLKQVFDNLWANPACEVATSGRALQFRQSTFFN